MRLGRASFARIGVNASHFPRVPPLQWQKDPTLTTLVAWTFIPEVGHAILPVCRKIALELLSREAYEVCGAAKPL